MMRPAARSTRRFGLLAVAAPFLLLPLLRVCAPDAERIRFHQRSADPGGVEPMRLQEVEERLGEIAAPLEGPRQAFVRLGIIGPEPARLVQLGEGALRTALRDPTLGAALMEPDPLGVGGAHANQRKHEKRRRGHE